MVEDNNHITTTRMLVFAVFLLGLPSTPVVAITDLSHCYELCMAALHDCIETHACRRPFPRPVPRECLGQHDRCTNMCNFLKFLTS
ncbi:hypothetical protein LSAT2_027238 [Lamellibrachia satsuma]|nr:hypothetical protein LSAT2_027238 [Lamellibrachia satsuma]